ncbi:MAG: DUF1549 domain-containing protein [Alphaproteobacteria bacterium]|nr:DUF1549 domain-containing protein [Alphaproteobacteria bacterium]MCB9696063.1 DUF1549 domain-containing protein [Alphaproteobacteria bacterium]
MFRAGWWFLGLGWAGCATPDALAPRAEPHTPSSSTAPPVEEPPASALTPSELLTRVSLDLRGIRPSIDELRAFDDAPGQYEAVVDAYLHDPHLQRRAIDFYSEIVPSRIAGEFYVDLDGAYGDRFDPAVLQQHVAEEPLRMFAWVVENDLPYGAMVEGNWTVVDDLLAQIFPVDYPSGGSGWQLATYTDGRPGAGALSTNGLWWFRGAQIMNRQRARGNLVSRVLLCDDYLERLLPFTRQSFASDEAMGDAVNQDPACQACHATLDPLSAHFWGFYYDSISRPSIIATYHAEQEGMWEGTTAPPGFMGQQSDGLGSLGALLQDDPRFATCFVDEAWSILSRTDASDLDIDLSDLVETFDGTGGNVREVFRAVVMRPEYRGYDARLARRRMAPQVFASMVEDLTGYHWSTGGVDQLTSFPGYGVMVGSSDGAEPGITSASVSTVLVQKRFAEAAAAHVVQQESASADRRLFSAGFDPSDIDDVRVRTELRHLYLRMLGRELDDDDPEITALFELYDASLDATGDVTEAWIAVVTGLLRHPDMENY